MGLLFATASLRAETPSLSAQQVIDRIEGKLNGYWPPTGNDGLKDGDPTTPVTGIAVTMMSTMDVLERSSASGCNFVITHEPTFYSGTDTLALLEKENDAVTATKRSFIREHHMVVFRIHDHWHFPLRVPDPVIAGVFKALNWSQYQHDKSQPLLRIPQTTVKGLAQDIRNRLDIHSLRVVGDPDMAVSKVGFLPGCPGWDLQRTYLQRDDVEVLVIGEAREWETIEYAADMVTQDRHKALIVMGHVPSEQAGSTELVEWLSPLVTEVKVREIATKEPFWSLASP